nr:immunoglobulin heavy chain junction region [Mus musculus]
CAGTGYYFDYW